MRRSAVRTIDPAQASGSRNSAWLPMVGLDGQTQGQWQADAARKTPVNKTFDSQEKKRIAGRRASPGGNPSAV